MKRFSFVSCILMAAFAVSNCSKEADVTKDELLSEPGVPFEIVASSATTRTVNDGLGTKWATDDKVSVFHAPAGGSYVLDGEFGIKDVETGLFDGTVTSSPVVGNQYDWIAVYPYHAQLTTIQNESGAYYYFGGRSDQSQTQSATNSTAHLGGSGLPMFGTVKAAEYTGEAPFIQMNHLAAIAAINVTNGTSADINVASVEFTAPVDIVGAFYAHFNGETPTYTDYKTYQDKTAKLEVTDGSLAQGATGKFYIVIKPFTATNGQTISVKVTTTADDSQTKVFNIASDVTFSAGKIKNVKMNFTKEHQELGTTYTQITSMSDFTNDGQYVFVMPDFVNNRYYVLNNNGDSGNLSLVTTITKTSDGLLTFEDPDNKYVWGVAGVSGNSFNFRNTTDNSYSCIYNQNTKTSINTAYVGSQYWTPELLTSGCFKIYNSNADPRFLSYGTTQTDAKAYKTSGTFKDHVQANAAPSQYSGAWAVLKLGGSSASTDPSIEPAVVSDIPARSATHTVTVTTNNTQSALVLKGVDGTVVTNATVEGNTVSYTVSNNYGAELRSGSVLVALADDETVTGLISISQKAPVWSVSRTEVEIKAPVGSTAQLTVNSDYDWTIDAASLNGMTVEPLSFTYNGDPKQIVTITATTANGTSASVDRGSFKIVRTDNAELGPISVSQKDATLATPVLTITSDVPNKKFTVSWVSVSNASKYEYYVLDGSEYKVPVTQTVDASTTSFVVTDITYGKAYTVSVRAIGNQNPWLDSAEASESVTVSNTTVPVSFAASDFQGQGTSGSGSSISSTKSGVTVSSDKGYCDGTAHVRIYGGGVITVSANSGSIAKIEFTSTSSGTSNNGPSKISLAADQNGSYSYSGSKGTWTGSATSVTFDATAQFRFTGIVVTFE